MQKLLFSVSLIACILTAYLFSEKVVKTKNNCQTIEVVDEKLHIQCIYPTVSITDGKGSGGSGFIVRSTKIGYYWHNTILSAAHILNEDVSDVQVAEYQNWSEIQKYKKYDIVVYATDLNRDLGIAYFISDHQMPVVELCFDATVYINTEVFHCGYALLDDVRIDYGQVTQPKITRTFPGMIRTNCFTFMGDSGGPLFLKSNYKAIAVCSGIRSHMNVILSNVSYYRPISELKTWDVEINNALESVYTESAALPILPFVKLKLKDYEYQLPE